MTTPLLDALRRRAAFKRAAVRDDKDRVRVRRLAFEIECEVHLAEHRAGPMAWKQLPTYRRCTVCARFHLLTVTTCDGKGVFGYELDLALGVGSWREE